MSSSKVSLWYEEHLQGRLLVPIALTVIGALVLLYFTGILPERIAALLLGVAIVLGACAHASAHLLDGATTPRDSLLCLGLTVAVAISAGIPIVTTLIPGTPRAQGSLHAVGDTIPLPEDARGSVRILLHGRVSGTGPADGDLVLSVGDQRLEGHFSRKPKTVRMGRRGSATLMKEQNSQYLTAEVPSSVDRIRVEKLTGSIAGPVQVEVFPDWLPEKVELALTLIFLLVGSVLAVRLGTGSSAPGSLALAMIFAMMIHRVATPESAIQPEMGALIVGGIVGLLIGSITTWIMKRLIGPRAELKPS